MQCSPDRNAGFSRAYPQRLYLAPIRQHADYRLGQVLLANNGWVIVYFEGEPSRPLAECRRKQSPLRDVAAMLRSFSYAKRSIRNTPALDVAVSFIPSPAGLLKLFEIESALYELRYEHHNRPSGSTCHWREFWT